MAGPDLPVAPSIQQQGSPSVVSISRFEIGPPILTSDSRKRKAIQQQLLILIHASKCLKRTNKFKFNVSQCQFPHCHLMRTVLAHMVHCTAGKTCIIRLCSTSRQIILHWKNCTRLDCSVCMPLKKKGIKKLQLTGESNLDAVKM